MKKVLCIVAAGLMIAALSTSCDKKCACKTYLNGEVQNEWEAEIDDESDTKCSDMNTVVTVAGKKNGIECKGTL